MTQLPLFQPGSLWTPPGFLPSLRGAQRIAVDIETCDPQLLSMGPGVRRGAYIVGIAVAIDGGPSFYAPIRHEGGDNLDPALVLGWAREEFGGYHHEVVGTNLLYDLDFLAQGGIRFGSGAVFRDVQIAEALIDENARSYSLDSIAKKYLGEGKAESHLRQAAADWRIDPKRDLWRLPARHVGAYAEGDVTLPLAILRRQLPLLKADELLPVFNLESRLIPMLLAMQRRGVRIDTGKLSTIREFLSHSIDTAVTRASEIVGHRVNPDASATFAPAFQKRGLIVPMTAKSGKLSITKAWLEANQSDELAALIITARKYGKVLSTFVDGYMSYIIDGRIHPVLAQAKRDDGGTVTGRFSCSHPNLQNIPARDPELGPMIRSLFLPDEGEIMARLDWSQIEYRLLAHFASGPGSDDARRAYNEAPDTDFHTLCATLAHMDPEDKFVRKRVKNINFCKVYGGGDAKVAEVMGVSIDEARAFIEIYDRELPWVKSTLNRAMNVASTRGYVKTLLGRRRRFDLWEPTQYRMGDGLPRERALEQWPGERLKRSFVYAALNAVMQGSAADLLKRAMLDIFESGACAVLGAPLMTVHDELVFSQPDTREGVEAIAEVNRIMETCLPLRVPILAELETGTNWGNCK